MFYGGIVFLIAGLGLLWIFVSETNSSWIQLAMGLVFMAAAIDLFVHCITYKLMVIKDAKWRATAVRFQFHTLGEIPGEYSKAGYIVESIDDLIQLIVEMRELEVTRETLLIQAYQGEVREDGLDPRTVVISGYGFVGTLSKPLAA